MKAQIKKPIAIIDIDGTICEVGPRKRFLAQNPPDWEAFYADEFDDRPIDRVCDFVRFLATKYDVFFCTSRRESVRQKTQLWIKRHLGMEPKDYDLIMRANSDIRPDTVSKIRTFRESTTEEEQGRVQLVLEDSPAVAAMWQAKFGYLCMVVS